MSIARVARGTASAKGVTQLTIPSVTCAEGSCLEVGIVFDLMAGDSANLTWGGVPMAQVWSDALGGGSQLEVYRLSNVSAGTHDVATQDWGGIGGFVGWVAMIAEEITDPDAVPQDRLAHAAGSGTSASSGSTPATSLADELLLAFLGTEGPGTDPQPDWTGGFSSGQRIGTSGGPATANATIFSGFRVVSAIGSYSADATLGTPRAWQCTLNTLKAGAVIGGAGIIYGDPLMLQSVLAGDALETGILAEPLRVNSLATGAPLAPGIVASPLTLDSTLEGS